MMSAAERQLPRWHRRLVLAVATHDLIALVGRQFGRKSSEREQARQAVADAKVAAVASGVPAAEVDAVLVCAAMPEKVGVFAR